MKLTIKTKFNIGDKVAIKNKGLAFTTYKVWAKKNKLNNFAYDVDVKNGAVGVVTRIGPHGCTNDILCGIEVDGKSFIIDECGLANA